MKKYIYLGDKLARLGCYAGRECTAVLNERGKCIRGRNANMLVAFDGVQVVVLARMLRKVKQEACGTPQLNAGQLDLFATGPGFSSQNKC